MNIELGYGHVTRSLSYEETRYQLLATEEGDEQPLTDAQIGMGLDEPTGSPSLEEIISPGESVLVVVSDARAPSASAQITHLSSAD